MATIVMTGAGKGVGFETALTLTGAAHRVVAVARSPEGLEKLRKAALNHSPEAMIHPFVFDIVHGDYKQAFLPFVTKQGGQVDILINNAGLLTNKPFESTSLDRKSTRLNSSHVKISYAVF